MIEPRCPAAELIHEVHGGGPGVVCRVVQLEKAKADSILDGEMSPLLKARGDGSSIAGFCCGRAFPKSHEGQEPRAHYTFCPMWEAVEEAEAARAAEAERIFERTEKPKILGVDKEVEAELLGIDVEQVPDRSGFAPKLTTGVEAMEEVATDPEWKETE